MLTARTPPLFIHAIFTPRTPISVVSSIIPALHVLQYRKYRTVTMIQAHPHRQALSTRSLPDTLYAPISGPSARTGPRARASACSFRQQHAAQVSAGLLQWFRSYGRSTAPQGHLLRNIEFSNTSPGVYYAAIHCKAFHQICF